MISVKSIKHIFFIFPSVSVVHPLGLLFLLPKRRFMVSRSILLKHGKKVTCDGASLYVVPINVQEVETWTGKGEKPDPKDPNYINVSYASNLLKPKNHDGILVGIDAPPCSQLRDVLSLNTSHEQLAGGSRTIRVSDKRNDGNSGAQYTTDPVLVTFLRNSQFLHGPAIHLSEGTKAYTNTMLLAVHRSLYAHKYFLTGRSFDSRKHAIYYDHSNIEKINRYDSLWKYKKMLPSWERTTFRRPPNIIDIEPTYSIMEATTEEINNLPILCNVAAPQAQNSIPEILKMPSSMSKKIEACNTNPFIDID